MGFFDKFLAFAAPHSFESVQNYEDNQRMKSDLAQFAKDPNYQIDMSGYNSPETAFKLSQGLQKLAAPTLMSQFKTGYENLTGTSDPRFFGDAESRAELVKNGLSVPTNNPAVSSSLADFQKEGEQAQSLKAAMENDPWALASVARDKDVAAGMKNTAEAAGIPIARQTAADKEARIQQQADFTEQQKRDAAAQQSDFEKMASGIGGRYQDAQPKLFNTGADGQLQQVPYTAPDGKQTNVWNDGFNYVDNNGDVTPRRIMPYDEARQLMMQAAADYPLANPKEALAELEKRYAKEYTDANYKPSAVNWNGTATTDKNQLQLAAESGDPLAQRIIAAQDARDIALNKAKAEDRRTILVQNPLPAKVEVNALTPEEQTALTTAIAERRLDPYKVNSKNQKLLAAAAMSHPGVDLNTIAAELGLARNTQIQIKAATAEMLPGLVQKTVEAGKALNYSDVKFVGAVEKWKQGQLNDPKLTKYMTLRNDQLLTIGGVMRSNGMTDMAQKLEEEAMHPTLSPKALDSWMEGQLESIDPRLNFYRNATKGNKAIPRANYTPKASTGYGTSSGAAIAPAGTKVARKGGGFYTSDGKGGWY